MDQLHYFLSNQNRDEEIFLSQKDLDAIEHEAKTRFSTWEWNYGYSPEFNLKNANRFSGGKIEVLLDVKEGIIQSIRFMGDYLGLKDVSMIEERLVGVRFKKDDVSEILSDFDLKLYFGSITLDEILSVIFY